MERQLVNIIEYLALGELESQVSTTYPRQQLFYDPSERRLLLQQVLNQLPPVYMWLSEDECPSLGQLTQTEQNHLRSVVQQEVKKQRQQAPTHPNPYSEMMTEVFY